MSVSEAKTPALEEAAGLFHPAPLVTLPAGSDCRFALYLAVPHRAGRRYVLFKSASTELTAAHRRQLLDNGVTALYVREEDAESYYEFVDQSVGHTLAATHVPPQVKSQILYDTTCALVKSVFERPDSPHLIAANRRLVKHSVSLLAAEPSLLRTMASLFTLNYSLYSHSVHVAVLALGLLLEADSRPQEDIVDLTLGFLLHDIGKCRIPVDILRKPAPLTNSETLLIEQHPEFGVCLLEPHLTIPPAALDIVRTHHERLDGSGYPRHLTQWSIPLETRVCSIADVYDALTSHRVYKPALSSFRALRLMCDTMSETLDRELIKLLIHLLGPDPTRFV